MSLAHAFKLVSRTNVLFTSVHIPQAIFPHVFHHDHDPFSIPRRLYHDSSDRADIFPSSSKTVNHGSSSLDSEKTLDETSWKVGKLNHIAIAVPNITATSQLFRSLFKAQVTDPLPQPEHGVKVSFLPLENNTSLEFLEPYTAGPTKGDKSPIANFLKTNCMGGIHHICIEVSDIQAAMRDIKKMGVRVLGEGIKVGAHGKPVLFLHPKDCAGVLIELEQE